VLKIIFRYDNSLEWANTRIEINRILGKLSNGARQEVLRCVNLVEQIIKEKEKLDFELMDATRRNNQPKIFKVKSELSEKSQLIEFLLVQIKQKLFVEKLKKIY
jgi:hypothetical protein